MSPFQMGQNSTTGHHVRLKLVDPDVVWMSTIASLIVFAVEMAVGVAFCGFAHIKADGDGFATPESGHGYGILLNAIFRPALCVLGLVFSSVIISVMAQFIDNSFVFAMNDSFDPQSRPCNKSLGSAERYHGAGAAGRSH